MLRMDRSPYSRLWAIWDDQDLVAVVVDKKGAAELLRRLQAARAAVRICWSRCASSAHHCRASSRAPARTPGVTPPGLGITRGQARRGVPLDEADVWGILPGRGPA